MNKITLKKFTAGLAAIAVASLGAVVIGVSPVDAALFGDDGDTDLGDLIILDQLFGGGVFNGGTTTGQRSVTVQPGDTLSGIALTHLGNANLWPRLADINNLSNPDLIFPGQVIVLPAAADGTDGGVFNGGLGDLGNLIILDELFGGNGGGLLGGDDNDLGDLFLLNALFGGNGGLFNGGTTGANGIFGNNLGQLLILDELFGDSGIFD